MEARAFGAERIPFLSPTGKKLGATRAESDWESKLPREQEISDREFTRKYLNRQAVYEQYPSLMDVRAELEQSPGFSAVTETDLHDAFFMLAEAKLGQEDEIEVVLPETGGRGFQIYRDSEGLVVQYKDPVSLARPDGTFPLCKAGFIDRPTDGHHQFHSREVELDNTEYGDEGSPSMVVVRNGKSPRLDIEIAFMSLLDSEPVPRPPIRG